ncbi:hypothetical protein BJX64DRAFT_281462 [Aspergillus heterothallicus]
MPRKPGLARERRENGGSKMRQGFTSQESSFMGDPFSFPLSFEVANWRKLFQDFLTEKQRLQFAVTKYEHVQDSVEKIQQKYGEKKELLNMYRIQSFLEAMNEYGKVVEVFLNCTPFVAYIWGPVKFVLQVASSWSDSLDIILSAYEEIGERAPSFLRYRLVFENNPAMRDMLEKWYCDVLQFHFHALQFLTRPRWNQLFKSSWKVFNSKFKRILDSLQRHKDLIESEKTTLAVYEIQTLRDDEAARFNESRLNDILDKINAPNCYLDQETVLGHRDNQESGKWVLIDKKFKEWRDALPGSNPLLYIHGIPGAGKTTLTSTIVDILCATLKSPVLFFYCNHRLGGRDSFVAILQGLLAQLFSTDRALAMEFSEKYCSYDRRRFETTSVLREAVDVAFNSQHISYVVLDGLDECDISEAEKTIHWFTTYQQHTPVGTDGHIRLLCVGQRTDLLQRMLSKAQDISLDTQQRHHEDIERYIQEKMQSISYIFDLDASTQGRIITKVSSVANGMFLYAKVVMDNLACQDTLDDLMNELAPGVFPDALDTAYQRVVSTVVEKAHPKQRRTALHILGWVTCATRPLKWREIQATFFIDPETNPSKYEERRLRATCRKFCSSLVDVHLGTTREPAEATLALVHTTAQEYLIRTNTIDVVSQHVKLGLFCSKYLLSTPFSNTFEESQVRANALSGYYALQDYAVSSIFDHFLAASEKGDNGKPALPIALRSSLESLFAEYRKPSESKRMATMNRLDGLDQLAQYLPSDADKRYALFDLEQRTFMIRAMLEQVRSELPHQHGCTILELLYGPISFKCPRPWCLHFLSGLDTVGDRRRHILRHDNPFICPDDTCPLHEIGFDSELRLNRHIIQYHSSMQDTPQVVFPEPRARKKNTLYHAVERGDLELAEKHINDGADVNEATSTFLTPLCLAAQNDHLAICHLLVKHGAKTDKDAYVKKSPLQLAIKNRRVDIVRYLLHVDANMFQFGKSGTVSKAIDSCNLEVLNIVIKSAARKLGQQELGDALVAASGMGSVELVELLIDVLRLRSARDLSSAVNWLSTTLSTQFLLQTDSLVTLNSDGENHTIRQRAQTPLHVAVQKRHTTVLKILLDAGANPNPDYSKMDSRKLVYTWESPLSTAVRKGYTYIAQLLLMAQSGSGYPPSTLLKEAARNGNVDELRLIIDSGLINATFEDMTDDSPLRDAIERNHLAAAKLIYELNPSHGEALFSLALQRSETDVVNSLLHLDEPALHHVLHRAAFAGDTSALRHLTSRKYAVGSAIKDRASSSCRDSEVPDWYTICHPELGTVIGLDLLHTSPPGEVIHDIALSRDGKYLATNSYGCVSVYDLIMGQPLMVTETNHGHSFKNLCFINDDHLVGRSGTNKICVWNIPTATSSTSTPSHACFINTIACTLNGQYLVISDSDRSIQVWDISNVDQPAFSHTLSTDSTIYSSAASFDGRYLAASEPGGVLWLWDLTTDEVFPVFQRIPGSHARENGRLSFSSEAYVLSGSSDDGTINSWSILPGTVSGYPPKAVYKGTVQGQFRDACLSRLTPDLRWLLSCESTGHVFIQSTENGHVNAILKAHPTAPDTLVCSSSGSTFATMSGAGQVRVWKLTECQTPEAAESST